MTQLESRQRLIDAAAARDEAVRLLDELVRERAAAEARQAAGGREDPIKMVSGRSAFDRAIRSTQDVLARMDALLMDGDEMASHRGDRCVRPGSMAEGR